MDTETLDIDQLAAILSRDAREVTKMASRGYLPGQKIAGQWRFASAEINYWIESQMHAYTEEELSALETGVNKGLVHAEPLIAPLMLERTMSVPVVAGTKSSLLRELIQLAEQSWYLYDPEGLADAIRQREEMGSTALAVGVALPHPHRPNASMLGDSFIAYARTSKPIPFGGPAGGMCDIFFLICCQDHKTHLKVLARLSRLLLRPGFVQSLREAESVAETWQIVDAAERELTE